MKDSQQNSKPSNVSVLKAVQEHLKNMSDLKLQKLGAQDEQIQFLYLSSLADSQKIKDTIITPYFEMKEIEDYENYLSSFPGILVLSDARQIEGKILSGYAVISVNEGTLYLFDAARIESTPVTAAETEVIVQGPSDSFNEQLDVNLNLIRHRYQSADLKVETMTIGTQSKTQLALIYDDARVDQSVLEETRVRLGSLSLDILQGSTELDRYLSSSKFNLFPTTIVTERPDRAVFNLSEGKIVIVVDTDGFVVILPVIFNDFFTAMDDKLLPKPVSWFLKSLRYLGLFLTVTLPAIYVAFSSYNTDVWKIQIALLVAGSRATVPYPSFIEVVIMLLMMEFLTEASLRLPKAIGSTATTVGGLILGTAATEAGLVSNIMIILVSVVAISNFVIPLNMMGFSVRILKYGLILLAALFGLVGIVCGCLWLTMYLASLRSFGKPYLRLFGLDRLASGNTNAGRGR